MNRSCGSPPARCHPEEGSDPSQTFSRRTGELGEADWAFRERTPIATSSRRFSLSQQKQWGRNRVHGAPQGTPADQHNSQIKQAGWYMPVLSLSRFLSLQAASNPFLRGRPTRGEVRQGTARHSHSITQNEIFNQSGRVIGLFRLEITIHVVASSRNSQGCGLAGSGHGRAIFLQLLLGSFTPP